MAKLIDMHKGVYSVVPHPLVGKTYKNGGQLLCIWLCESL